MQNRFPIHPLLNPTREVIIFGKDPLLLKRLAPALPFGHFQILVNPSTGKDLVQKRRCGVLILDQELFETDGSDGGEHLLKIYREVAELGAKTLFIFLFRPGGKLTTFFQDKVASELEINLTFHRDHISASQLQFVLNLFARQEYRSIFLKDLSPGLVTDVALYHFNTEQNRLVMVNDGKKGLTPEEQTVLHHKGINKLYIKSNNMGELLSNPISTHLKISLSAHEFRKYVRRFLAQFHNERSFGKLQGPLIIKDVMKEVRRKIFDIYGRFDQVKEALHILPFERPTLLSIPLNGALYFYGLGTIEKLSQEEIEDGLAVILLSCLGFGRLHSAPYFEDMITSSEHALEYKLVPQHTLQILEDGRYVVNERVKQLISSLPEHFDGSGWPRGIRPFASDKLFSLTQLAWFFATNACTRGKSWAQVIQFAKEQQMLSFGKLRFNAQTLNELGKY